MAGLSNIIERFIDELMEETGNGVLEIQRNQMAEQFDCSPSQINYVLSTRFTPYQGYYIESRRGGGGYIRIIKIAIEEDDELDIIINNIGDSITKNKAHHILEGLKEDGLLSEREFDIIKVAIRDSSLIGSSEEKNCMRGNILKNILLILAQ